jgi:crossover junction endodeoxyribonuclease RuvC
MSALVVGVDIGLSRAIAVVDVEGGLIAVHDMPCLDGAGPAGRRAICAPLVADLIFKTHAVRAFVERVGARPGEGPAGAFAFGQSAGIVAGVLASAGIPATLLTPPHWKRLIGIAPGKAGAKDLARAEAIRRWPDKAALFARKRDDGRAEAALIAAAGLLRETAR